MRSYLFIIFLFLISCENKISDSNFNDEKKEISTKILSGKYKTIDLNGYYSVDIPIELIKADKPIDFGTYQYINLEYKFSVVIQNECIQEALYGLASIEIEFDDNNANKGFLNKYLQIQLNNLRRIIHEDDKTMVKITNVNGYNALTFETTGNLGNDKSNFIFSGTVVEGRSDLYYIYIVYREDKKDSYYKIKNHILKSFKLNELSDNIEQCGLITEKYDEAKEDLEDPEYRGDISEPVK